MDDFPSDNEILSLSGAEALAWYQSVADGSVVARKDLDWTLLAKGAALRARINDAEESLAWAQLAVASFRRLDDGKPGKEHDHSEMYCRTAMIEKHGLRSGDKLRDPEVVFDWFRERLPSDYEATLVLLGRLTEAMSAEFESDVVAPLRSIKNRLTVVRALPKECEVPSDIEQYDQLYHQLP